MDRSSRSLQLFFSAPRGLYRVGLGWVLGHRFLSVGHRGRKSGKLRETVLEVAGYDPATRESVVASAYGTAADWYRNITVEPAQRVRTGRMDYVPEQRFLTAAEAREAAIEFCRRHKLEARLAPRALTAIGAVQEGAFTDPVELLASLPMVAFRPKE